MDTPNKTLWQIQKDLLELNELISEVQESEDLSPEEKDIRCDAIFADWLSTEGDFKKKITRIVPVIKKNRANAEAAKAESKRLDAVAKYFDAIADRWEGYTLNAMITTGITKVEGPEGIISTRKKQGEVVLDKDVEELPPEYVRVTLKPQLAEIRKAIKAGKIEWAHIEDNGYSLTIK